VNDEKAKRIQELEDVRQVMQTVPGRRFLWRILGTAGVGKTVFEPFANLEPRDSMLVRGARQDFGHFVCAEILASCPELYDTMSKEAREMKALEGRNS
jgi:hypothetical protein